MLNRLIAVLLTLTAMTPFSPAQESKFIDFEKYIQPILQNNCLRCHGPDDAKNDFRVDERNSLLEYIEPGDADSSSLWSDYLFTEDHDLLMPPDSPPHAGGLSQGDLLFVRTWINEGAEGEWVVTAAAAATATGDQIIVPTSSTSTAQKLWAFQGIFHPAAVHLPVALLSVSALFVFLSFFRRDSFEPVAYHCLWIGALGAVAACATGWSYAVYEGYGSGFNLNLKNGIDRHRWAGVSVTVLSCLLIPLSRRVRRSGEIKTRLIWLMASILLISSVSITGYQGGELTYGEDHYMKYYKMLFQTPNTSEASSELRLPTTPETKTPETATAPLALHPDNPSDK